jgi:hypothetical protein
LEIFGIMAYQGNNLTTLSHKLYVARGLAGFDTQIDLTTAGNAEQRPTTGVLDILRDDIINPKDTPVFAETPINGVCFMFMGTAAADKNMAWRLLAWRNENGPAEIVANGTAITGTQAVVKYPHNGVDEETTTFWCDTITLTAESWPKEIETTDTTGNNSIAKLFLDACGYRYFKMEITATGADDVTEAACYYGYF